MSQTGRPGSVTTGPSSGARRPDRVRPGRRWRCVAVRSFITTPPLHVRARRLPGGRAASPQDCRLRRWLPAVPAAGLEATTARFDSRPGRRRLGTSASDRRGPLRRAPEQDAPLGRLLTKYVDERLRGGRTPLTVRLASWTGTWSGSSPCPTRGGRDHSPCGRTRSAGPRPRLRHRTPPERAAAGVPGAPGAPRTPARLFPGRRGPAGVPGAARPRRRAAAGRRRATPGRSWARRSPRSHSASESSRLVPPASRRRTMSTSSSRASS